MSVYPRSWQTKKGKHTSWYVQFQTKGIKVHEKATDPDSGLDAHSKREAQIVEAKLRQRIAMGTMRLATVPTVEAFIESVYLPWAEVNHSASHFQSDRWRTKVLIAAFGSLRIDEISPFAVERFKKEYLRGMTKRKKPRSPTSVNRCLQLLSKVLSLAEDHKLIQPSQRPDLKLLREENHRLRYLSAEEELRLRPILARKGDYLANLVIVWLNTGLRANEMFSLQTSDVDFHLNIISVKGKGGKLRQVPIFGECREVLKTLCAGKLGLVIPSPKTGGKLDNVKKGFRSACKEAGIVGVTPHTLRHTYGTRLAAAGVDVITIKDLMGHSSITTTMRYVHAVAENKHLAVQKLDEYLSRQSQAAS